MQEFTSGKFRRNELYALLHTVAFGVFGIQFERNFRLSVQRIIQLLPLKIGQKLAENWLAFKIPV